MVKIDQPVLAIGCLEIDTSACTKQNKQEQLVQTQSITTSDVSVAVRDSSVTAIPTNDDEDKEDPQDKENQQVIGGDSSLSYIMSTYSEDEE